MLSERDTPGGARRSSVTSPLSTEGPSRSAGASMITSALSRRSALRIAASGALALTGCHAASEPDPSPTPAGSTPPESLRSARPSAPVTPTAAQWVSSDDLSRAEAFALDLAALNRKAGLVTGPAAGDAHGPYLPLQLPPNHPILKSHPSDPNSKALASRSTQHWHKHLRRLAGPCISLLLDPDNLLTHDKQVHRRWVERLGTALFDTPGLEQPDYLWGSASILNTDGKLLERLGATPVARTKAGPRFGVHTLWWTVSDPKDPRLTVGANATARVMRGGLPYQWQRRVRLTLDAEAQNVWVDGDDECATTIADPLKRIPTLTLGTAPSSWGETRVGPLGLWLPPGLTRRDMDGETLFVRDKQTFCSVQVVDTQPGEGFGWQVLPGYQNTRFTLPGGQVVLAEWGPNALAGRFGARGFIYGRKKLAQISFVSSPQRVVQDLRQHAASWAMSE